MIKQQSRLKLAAWPVFLFLFFVMTSFNPADPANRLVGIWDSEEKNLRIEMFEENGQFAGKMTWFKCSSETIMQTSCDIENPDSKLTGRKLLGLKLVERLSYRGNGVWDKGKIYDPNSGNTFDARIQLTGPNTAVVRGYWKFKWLGRSMVFNRRM